VYGAAARGRPRGRRAYDPVLGAEPGAEPDGGVPWAGCPLEPLPMLGQFLVELVPEPAPELVEPDDELGALDEPELPVAVVVVVLELVLELVPVLPEPELPEPVLEVVADVAASATRAPPTTRPEVKAPMASALRICRCMGCSPFVSCCTRRRDRQEHDGPSTLGRAQDAVGVCVELPCGRVTFLRRRRSRGRRA
jgi:hypothetical protein